MICALEADVGQVGTLPGRNLPRMFVIRLRYTSRPGALWKARLRSVPPLGQSLLSHTLGLDRQIQAPPPDLTIRREQKELLDVPKLAWHYKLEFGQLGLGRR